MFFIIFLGIIFLLFFLIFKFNRNETELSLASFIIITLQSLIISLSLSFFFWEWQSKMPQKYSEFTFGNIAYELKNKDSDILALFFAILVFLMSFIFIEKLHSIFLKAKIQNSNYFSLLTFLPFFIMLGQILRIENVKYLLVVSLSFVLLDIFSKIIILFNKKKINENDLIKFQTYLFLSIIFIILSSIGLSIFITRINLLFLRNYIFFFYLFSIILILFFLNFKKDIEFFQKIKFILFLSQIGLPFLLSIFLSPILITNDGVQKYLPYRSSLYFLLIIFALFSYFDIFKRFIRKEEKIISPFSLILILLFLLSEPLYWPVVFNDDFHGGHWYLPWFLLKEYGYIPFIDFQPAHGLLNLLPGFFSFLFFDGTYSGIGAINNILSSFFIIFLFFALRKHIPDLPAFLIAFSSKIFYYFNLTLFPLGFSIFLFLLKLKIDKIYTFWFWFFSSFFLLFFNLPEGAPFVLGVSPFGIYSLYKILKISRKKFLISLCIFFILILFLFIFTNLDKIILKEFKYLYDNAKVNSIAQGLKWEYPDYFGDRVTSGPLWQFVRFGWIFIFIPFLFLIYLKRNELKENPKLFILLISLILICIFLIPRSAGRIDKMQFSRPFTANAILIFGLPLITFPLISEKGRVYFLLFFSVLLGVLGFQEKQLRNSVKFIKQTHIKQPEFTVSGKNEGIYSIGEDVQMDKNQILRQKNIQIVLNKLLSKDETFYDTTNHIADYFFQNKRCPTSNSTIYDISSEAQQRQILKELKNIKPPLVLISSENIYHDGGTLPFRAPEIYFFLVKNYFPFKGEGDYIWMIYKDEISRLNGTGYEINDFKGQIELLKEAFELNYLKGLPSSWGSSFRFLKKKLKEEVDLLKLNIVHKNDIEKEKDKWKTSGNDPYIVFSLPENTNYDFLYIKLKFFKKVKGYFRIYWKNELNDDFNERDYFIFNSSEKNEYIVPLSYAPSWYLAEKNKFFRISFPQNKDYEFEIIKLKFFSRIKFNISRNNF